ncbi:hypothetical protein BIW11_06822 [Tropilaelaps mercedesae]|uniref:Uncharacterized protein n=1 Tax=Tropilaelaps mercedesae TaxID=418985 RepID=A0A1V9XWD5_9ACAR|nr:hypothetical protein BIW11_06822 [Tropilaelaps mercedesae]
MNWCLPAVGEYAVFWAVDRVCKYYVDKDYDKRYQIWRSEFEILVLLIVAWSACFRAIPWVCLFLTLLTWLASVPNEGHKILFEGRVLLLGPVIKKAFNNTLRHYRNLRDGAPGASENASLIERIIFSFCLLLCRLREGLIQLRIPLVTIRERIGLYWREMVENYRNMELETPHQSFAATHKSVSFDASPTVFTFSPPQMSSTPNNNAVAQNKHESQATLQISNGIFATPSQAQPPPRRTSLRRQVKGAS